MRHLLLRKLQLKTDKHKNLSLIMRIQAFCFLGLFINNSFADNTHCSIEPFDMQSMLMGSMVAFISKSSNEKTVIYKTNFESNPWQGELTAVSLQISDDSIVDHSVLWQASEIDNIKRNFFSINSEINTTHQGIKLSWENLNKQQKTHLKANASDGLAKKRLAWLLGSKIDKSVKLRRRRHFLGDIIGSNISIASHQKDYGYSVLEGNQGKRYTSFLEQKTSRPASLFVGANDGALHAFDALNGNELFAYVPNVILPKIATISQPNYGCKDLGCLPHEFLVDGKSSVADAYFNDDWHSVLIGSLGFGGKGLYALDVTDVEHFNEKSVLWEISTQDSHIDSDTYKQHLGFIDQEASIVRLKNGRWVVIVGNGINSTSQQAVLFIIDLKTGHLIKSLNTGAGSVTQPNGLSTPLSIDINDDKSVDRVYAGDLLGNIWRFNLNDSDPAKWTVAFGRKPLFRACEDKSCNKPQSVTAKLQAGNHPEGGLMVYFGTHQAAHLNSLYAIRDNDTRVLSSKNLVKQQILQEGSVGSSLEMRVTSNFEVDYKRQKGWMLKLGKEFSPVTGERISTQVLLHEGQLIVSTEIPLGESCTAYQSRWIMKLDALQGKRPKQISFDTNKDHKLTVADNADYDRQPTIVSGIHLEGEGAMASQPVILRSDKYDESIISVMDDGRLKSFKTSATVSSGRVSWRQLR